MKLINWRLAIVAIFLSVVACKKPKTDIGLGLQASQLETNVDESTAIEGKTFKLDSIRTDQEVVGNYLLGNYSDPLIGAVRTSIYSQVALTGVSPNQAIFENTVIDSTTLTLIYNGYSYGTGNDISFDIFEVTEDFGDDPLYSNRTLSVDQSLIEDANITYKADSIINQQKIEIPLNAVFGEKLQGATSSDFASGTNFIEFFKGINIISNTADGRVLSFNLSSSFIKVNYHEVGDTMSLEYDFSLSSETKRFTHIEQDYTLSFVDDTLVSNDRLFVQGGGSLGAKISLIDLLDNHPEGEIFNKVDLVVPFDTTDVESYSKLLLAKVFLLNDDGEYIAISSQGSNVDNTYRFTITPHIQSLVNRTIIDQDIYFFTDKESSGVNPGVITVSRIPILVDEIKLHIIHTE